MRVSIDQDILGLDVSMAYAYCVDIGDGAHKLVSIDLN